MTLIKGKQIKNGTNLARWRERRVEITKEVSEEGFEMEVLALEDTKMLEAIENGLGVLFRGVWFILKLKEKLV